MSAAQVAAIAAVLLLIPLAADSCAPTEDRQTDAGTQADTFADATHVTIYRNADTVPNLAIFCAGDYGWAATLKANSGGEGSGSVALVRFPDLDSTCNPTKSKGGN